MHRVAQLVSHVTARVRPEELALPRRVLTLQAQAMFEAMPVADRRHGLDVAERLLAAGHDEADLLAAALLHDVAKGRQTRLAHRVAGVLLEAAAPRQLERLALDDRRSWRYGFHLYLHHAPISASAAVAAGCTPRAGAFISGEDVAADDAPLLAALRTADEAS